MKSLPTGMKRHVAMAILLAIVSSHAFAGAQKPSAIADPALEALDRRFQAFSSRFYSRLVAFENLPKAKTLQSLAQTVDLHLAEDQPVAAVATVLNNLALVEKNVDTTPIIRINGLLFDVNEWNTATQLYKKVKAHGDKSLVSNVSLFLAKHHFDRNHWKETIGIVETLRSDLAPEDFHHALLMHGISLQQLKKHREALRLYAKIPPTSRYYTASRLNMAIANIRQDWWTDAHTIINDLLADKSRHRDDSLTDRLYTVLGYSLLQQQYYRNSREAFRNVTLDGKYANKALLGIALTAAYQEDHIGALNAINILKEKKYRDLPVDEANLLVPHFYEKLRQLTTASAAYAEAIAFYENRVQGVKSAIPGNPEIIKKQIVTAGTDTVTLNDEIVDLGERLPKFVFENVRMMVRFRPHIQRIGDASLSRDYDALDAEYGKLLLTAARLILEEKVEHLTHYMNQSRYGLARMQDHDAIAPK